MARDDPDRLPATQARDGSRAAGVGIRWNGTIATLAAAAIDAGLAARVALPSCPDAHAQQGFALR